MIICIYIYIHRRARARAYTYACTHARTHKMSRFKGSTEISRNIALNRKMFLTKIFRGEHKMVLV